MDMFKADIGDDDYVYYCAIVIAGPDILMAVRSDRVVCLVILS